MHFALAHGQVQSLQDLLVRNAGVQSFYFQQGISHRVHSFIFKRKPVSRSFRRHKPVLVQGNS